MWKDIGKKACGWKRSRAPSARTMFEGEGNEGGGFAAWQR